MGTTYRERRLAKAERLRGYAENREAKQGALNEAARADEGATGIPFGQPILVGHHSEGRHRRRIAQIDRAMGAAVENSQKAAAMASRADSIEAAAERAIYDDDPDAIERLREKIAGLEAQRETMKTRNAEFRKANREELKGMSAYERGQAVPFPSYVLSNLGGVLSTSRKRLARLEGLAAGTITLRDRIITARYAGECADCSAPIERGQQIRYTRTAGARCAPACGEA